MYERCRPTGDRGRLFPLTKITTSICYPFTTSRGVLPLQTLVDAGITEILLVTGADSEISCGYSNGSCSALILVTRTRKGRGIAVASLWRSTSRRRVLRNVSDNIIERSIRSAVNDFKARNARQDLLRKFPTPTLRRGGLQNDRIVGMKKSPEPQSHYAVPESICTIPPYFRRSTL